MATKSASPRLPKALAVRAQCAANAKIARLVEEAKRDIDLIRRRRENIADAFYDIGEALVRLKRREIVAALGCKSFAQLCEEHVGVSSTQADRLIDIVTNMSRKEALAVGATKAASLVALARATPADDTPGQLLRRGVAVRKGAKPLDVKRASTRAIARVTAEIRGSTSSKISKQEHATVRALEKSLKAAGVTDARITLKAGRRAGEARAQIDIAVADIARLGEAVRVVRR